VFDIAYFSGLFAERVREFSHDNGDARVRVQIVTVNGEQHDALHLRAGDTGGTVLTRDARLIFVPYAHIAYVEVEILNDRRIPGFELLVDS
jgi:hypothetical protein